MILLLVMMTGFAACSSVSQVPASSNQYVPNYRPSHLVVESPFKWGIAGNEFTFFVSAIDDGDALKYEFDWNNDGYYDGHTENFMAAGYPVEISHIWPSPGLYTFSVRAVDPHGSRSIKKEFKVTILRSPPSS